MVKNVHVSLSINPEVASRMASDVASSCKAAIIRS